MKKNVTPDPTTIKTEADYKEFERLSKKLHLPVAMVHVIVEASKDGKLTGRLKSRSHTWNRNFWNWTLAFPSYLPCVVTNFGAGYISLKQTGATVSALNATQLGATNIGIVSNSAYGILAGRGSGAESFEGYAFTTPIAHGSGANQLSHRAQDATLQGYTAGTKVWAITLKRLFDNLSGSTITVTETGIVISTAAYNYNVMICRDLLGASVNVLNNGVLSITYIFSLTFPA